MSIIQAIIATSSMGAGGGSSSKSASWYGITWEPVQEGQQNHAQIQLTNWDNSTVYWTVVGPGNSYIGGQLASYSGSFNPGTGNNIAGIDFTFLADRVTDGNSNYYVNIGSSPGQQDYVTGGPFTVRDSSQAPALVLDLNPANYNPSNVNVWPDISGNSYNAGIYSYAFNASEAGGVMTFDGTTSCEVPGLATGINYGSATASIWFKADAVTGAGNQTLMAKELVYKLRITDAGTINVNTSIDGTGWSGGGGTTSGAENLTAGVWNHLALSINDNDNIRLYLNGVEIANFSQTILGRNNNPFNIGMWQTTGSPQDYFSGMIGEVRYYNYGLTGSQVLGYFNSTANRYGLTPIPQSLNFVGSGQTYIDVSTNTTDWNLGSIYTIEFWSNEGNASSGTIRTVVSQGGNTGRIDVGFTNEHLLFNNSEYTGIPEPTPGVWTHVAIVSDGTNDIQVYYDGRLAGTMTPQSLSDGSSNLVIGRRGAGNYQYFYGKLANIKISDVARYTGEFAPSTVYTADSNTKLILGTAFPTTDNSSSGHGTTVYSVSTDLAVPHSLVGAYHGYSGGTFGDFYSVFGDPNIVAVSHLPLGARITSNIPNFGVRIVTGSLAFGGGWDIVYDATGLSGATSTSDIFNFYW